MATISDFGAETAAVAERQILRPHEISAITGAHRQLIRSLVDADAVRPAIRGSRRREHLFDTPGAAGVDVYMALRRVNVEAALCRTAARIAQVAGSDVAAAVRYGRTYLLVLPSGVSDRIYTHGEAREALTSLADEDLGRAVVVNLLPIWLSVVARIQAFVSGQNQ